MFYEINQTRKVCIKNKILFALFFALGSLIFTTHSALAQTAQPTPSPQSEQSVFAGGYNITSSMEFGLRGISVNGSDNKYRSDLNYKPGFRIFDSSFLMEDKENKKKLFDSLLVNSSGWSADPTGFTRIKIEKTGIYRFDTIIRRVTYFNNLNNHALNEHTQNVRHKFGDFDLTVFPESDNFRLRFGYGFDRNSGPAVWTVRAYGDEYPVASDVQSRANDFRAGVEGKLLGFNLSLSHGYRYFKDGTEYTITGPNPGNTTTNTSALATYSRQFPVKGNSHYTLFNAQRTFAKKVDFTARIIYSSTDTVSQMFERITGRDASNNIIDLDRFEISGDAKRPQTRGNLGLTFLVTDKFTISETFSFDTFHISGGERFAEALFSRTATGNPRATVFTDSFAHRLTSYRRFVNTIEADYQVNNRFGFHVGYRYTDRRAVLGGFNQTFTSPPSSTNPSFIDDEEDNRTNALIAGMKVKPTKNWTLFWDVEHGSADNVFTRLENYKYTNFRARSRLSFNKFALNLSAASKDNNNPSRTIEVPPRDFGADINNRNYSATVDWMPTPKLSFSSGYTYQHLTSETAIIVPVGSVRLQGFSQYFMRDHYAFLDVFAHLHNRVSFYGSYRISKDNGQGDRASTVLQNIITSYPFQLQSPEFRFVVRLTNNVDWNIGYQYYNYRERFQRAQDYRAHLPYTSLRIYIGRKER